MPQQSPVACPASACILFAAFSCLPTFPFFQRSDGLGPVSGKPPQPLVQRDDPLPNGHWRDDVVDEVGRRLRHVPAVAGRADAPSLAREGHAQRLRAPCAERAGDRAGNAAAEAIMSIPSPRQATGSSIHYARDAAPHQPPPRWDDVIREVRQQVKQKVEVMCFGIHDPQPAQPCFACLLDGLLSVEAEDFIRE